MIDPSQIEPVNAGPCVRCERLHHGIFQARALFNIAHIRIRPLEVKPGQYRPPPSEREKGPRECPWDPPKFVAFQAIR